MNMKNALITAGISLITAGIGFIVGSKWTEKEITKRTEDFYQKEYDLLKKTFEERKEAEIREDQKRKDAEIVEEVKKMQDGIRRHVHESDSYDGIRRHVHESDSYDGERGRVDEPEDWDDEEELEEFGGKTEEDDIWEAVEDNYDENTALRNRYGHPKSRCQDPDIQDEYERLLHENDKRRENGCDVYIISYEEYWSSDCNEEALTYDPNNQMLIRDSAPLEEVDADELVSFEALQLLDEGFTDVVYVHNKNLDTDFVISVMDPRD